MVLANWSGVNQLVAADVQSRVLNVRGASSAKSSPDSARRRSSSIFAGLPGEVSSDLTRWRAWHW